MPTTEWYLPEMVSAQLTPGTPENPQTSCHSSAWWMDCQYIVSSSTCPQNLNNGQVVTINSDFFLLD